MGKNTSRYLFFALTVFIILTSTLVAIYFAGVEHETEHLKNIFITIAIVLLFQMLIGEPIKLILLSIDWACWPSDEPKYKPYKPEDDDDENYNKLDFLKQRLKSLRIQILLNERYRDTELNDKYRSITLDLILFGKFLFMLTCMVLVTRDELLYHNTAGLQKLFMENHTTYMGIRQVWQLNQLFDFVESSLVSSFDYGTENGAGYWVHSEPTKMLGVVRMRQLRLLKEQFGWGTPQFSELKYMPNWELPYRRLHYTDKYWRIYDPWLPISDHQGFIETILMNFEHVGQFQNYPELQGYVTVLARNKQNSMKILDFLSETNWLTYNTSAVFLDFTLYNVDANMFSVCTLRVERTPFGSIIPDVDCDSVKLVEQLEQLSFFELIVLCIYIIVVLQFIHSFIANLWYHSTKMSSIWTQMDLIIIVLNVMVITLVIVRATIVNAMLKRMEGANKLEFLNFRIPTRLHSLTNILIGFLICLTTLRMWRVLQFSKVFQLFTQTFSLAWKALASTMMMILIILIAFGIAFVIINGNNSDHFVRLVKSIVTSVCFCVGFSKEINPVEVFHGGKLLGMFLYATLGFVVSVLLINVFVITIVEYFRIATALRNAKSKRRINFFEFLRIEYNNVFTFFHKLPCFRKSYKRNNRTVAENIKFILDRQEAEKKAKQSRKKSILSSSTKKPPPPKDEETLQAEYRERIEYVQAVSTVLNTQFKILNLILRSGRPKKRKRDEDSPFLESDEESTDEDEKKKPDGQTTDPTTNVKKDEN